MDSSKRFEDFEKDVMTMLLSGEDNTLLILRKQYESARVISRDFTGKGFFTLFQVADNTPKLQYPKSLQLGDVIGEMDGVAYGVGFVLFIRDGMISTLEGYTYSNTGDQWSNEISGYKLSYHPGEERDIEKLKNKWTI